MDTALPTRPAADTGHSAAATPLRERVTGRLEEFLAQATPDVTGISIDLVPFTDALREILRGGKRLRPAFAYWGWRGAGRADCEQIVTAAAALELLQACALVHDDVMDGSDTRRGLPSAHRRFAALHQENDWQGSSERFGIGAAILLGDLCLAWADQMLLGCALPWQDLARAKPVYDVMRTELMAGQYLDLLEQSEGSDSVERAMTVVRYKAAKYTVERPLHIGAALAGADDALMTAYSAYGLPLGEAFQLRDDVLGVFGDPGQTGKPAGDDLREGKRTVLIAMTTERATPAQATVLRRDFGDPELDLAGVDRLRTVIDESGALGEVEALIATLTSESLTALESADVEADASDALAALAEAATRRSA